MKRDYFNPKSRPVQIRLTQKEYNELSRIAEEESRTISSLLRHRVVDYLVNKDK